MASPWPPYIYWLYPKGRVNEASILHQPPGRENVSWHMNELLCVNRVSTRKKRCVPYGHQRSIRNSRSCISRGWKFSLDFTQNFHDWLAPKKLNSLTYEWMNCNDDLAGYLIDLGCYTRCEYRFLLSLTHIFGRYPFEFARPSREEIF